MAAATQKLSDLFSTRGPSTTQVLRVVMLVLLSGVLLLLAGLALAGTLIGLAVTAPLFVLFSPVLIPAALTIGLAVAGFLTSVAFGVTALFFLTWMVNYLRRTRERPPASEGQPEDYGAPTSSTSPQPSDSGPSAPVNNEKEKSDMLVNQQQQNKGMTTLRKADDTEAFSSYATSTGSNNYDVFLSFRGLDTRNSFVDHLYHSLIDAGIFVFRDDDELCEGENIGSNLLQAIKNSKISIPVLSQNYASSKWCLQELVQMVECMKSGHVILPIFYHVEPADVRHQKGNFGGTFSDLSGKYVEEAVAKWTQALQEVASLKGWDSKTTANGREGELVKLVVTKVWSELKKAFQLVVTKEPVGINSAVKEVLRLLDDNPNATKIIGIHGMGGIGKTTLAKTVYNKLFDQFRHRSFIADIRESSQRNGILSLQNQLICDILKTKDQVSNTDEAINTIISRCTGKKVLILLDDVDHKDQLEHLVGKHDWFERGSRIIITTRIKSVLNDDDEVNCNYEHKEIDEGHSLILFSRHAFLSNSPPRDFVTLSHDIISTTRGLPLALEVIGSFLRGKKPQLWRGTLERLKKVPHDEVQKKLRISYDALNRDEQHIFLDIACFFIGTDVRIASYLWEACDLSPRWGIEKLCFMSLIKKGDNHELEMHDQLRDLGRSIAHEEVYASPMNRIMLWDYRKALEVLQRNKETKRIEALRLDEDGSSKFMEQARFKRMPYLRFLHGSTVVFDGDFEDSLSELRWLKWERCPNSLEATNVHSEKLLILDLSGGYIRENWGGWSSIKIEWLKVLNLSGCSQLKTIPNLSAFKSLEMLILNACKRLKELPKSLVALRELRHLSLKRCYVLKQIPSSIGELGELVELDLSSTSITVLPKSIKRLKKLEILRISHNEIKKLPSGIGKLESLQELDATACPKLREQFFVDKGGLSSLRTLRLDKASISGLPENFQELSSLQHLDLLYCTELQSLPEPPSRLSSLQLTCRSPTLPSLSHLSYLRTLTLHLCTSLESIPELPSYIQKLRIQKCPKLKTLPNLSNLKSLSELELSQCYELMELNGLEGLESLRKLDVSTNADSSNRDNLEDLDLAKYSDLQIHDGEVDNLFEIRGLGQLKSLEVLNISARKHIQVLDLSGSEHLKRLIVSKCESLVEIRCHDKIKEPLEHFDWDGCRSLERVPDFLAHDKS